MPFGDSSYSKATLQHKSLVWTFDSKPTSQKTYTVGCLINKVTRKLACRYQMQDLFPANDTNPVALAIAKAHWWPNRPKTAVFLRRDAQSLNAQFDFVKLIKRKHLQTFKLETTGSNRQQVNDFNFSTNGDYIVAVGLNTYGHRDFGLIMSVKISKRFNVADKKELSQSNNSLYRRFNGVHKASST